MKMCLPHSYIMHSLLTQIVLCFWVFSGTCNLNCTNGNYHPGKCRCDCHNSWKGDSCGMAVTFKLDCSYVWVTVVVWGDCHNSWKGDSCGMAVTFNLDCSCVWVTVVVCG